MSTPYEADGLSRRGFLAVVGAGALAAELGGAGTVSAERLAKPEGITALGPADMLQLGLVYLNSATLGCCPANVLKEMLTAAQLIERCPADEAFGPFIQQMETVRAKAAKFLGCATEHLAITNSTTDGMNLVAQGIDLRAGDRVLTTDHEHPGGAACWEYYAARRGVAIDRVELPPPEGSERIADLIAAKLTKATRVVSVSHVMYATGLRMPIARIAKLVKESGALLVVDGAQAPGVLDVDVSALGCHAYATSAHKGMLAPKGTGLLYISPEAAGRIDPLQLHLGRQAYTGATGTRNIPAIIGLGAAIDYLDGIGKKAIEAHVMKLRERLVEGLRGMPGVEIVCSPGGEFASGIVSVILRQGTDIHAVAKTLREKHNVVMSAKDRVHAIRISLHLYNGQRDVEAALAALRAELAAS